MEDCVIIWHPMLFEDELGHPTVKSSHGEPTFFEDQGVQDKNSSHGAYPE